MSLQRSAPLERKTPLRRTPTKRRQPARDWSGALDKIEEEGRCRVCKIPDGAVADGQRVRLECAHTISRQAQDEERTGPRGGVVLVVKRESAVPLCQDCHRAYDARRLDLLPHLFLPEQVEAVRAAGGIASANRRLSGSRA
jgi:hypothetical protein